MERIEAITFLLALAGGTVTVLWMAKRVLNKAGYTGWWLLTLLVPILFYTMLWVFAFTQWPTYSKNHKFDWRG